MKKSDEKIKLRRSFAAQRNIIPDILDLDGHLRETYNPYNPAFYNKEGQDAFNQFCSIRNLNITPANVQTNNSLIQGADAFSLVCLKWKHSIINMVADLFDVSFDYAFMYVMFHDADVNRYDADDAETANDEGAMISELFNFYLEHILYSAAQVGSMPLDDFIKTLPFEQVFNAFANFDFSTIDFSIYSHLKNTVDLHGKTVQYHLDKWLFRTVRSWSEFFYNKKNIVFEVHALDPRAVIKEIQEINFYSCNPTKWLHVHFVGHNVFAPIDKTNYSNDSLIIQAKADLGITQDRDIGAIKYGLGSAVAYLTHSTDDAKQKLKTPYSPNDVYVFSQYHSYEYLSQHHGADFAAEHPYDKNHHIAPLVSAVGGAKAYNNLFDNPSPWWNCDINDTANCMAERILYDYFMLKIPFQKDRVSAQRQKTKEYECLIEEAYYNAEFDPLSDLDTIKHDLIENSSYYRIVGQDKKRIDGRTLFDKEHRSHVEHYLKDKKRHLADYFTCKHICRPTIFFGGCGGSGKTQLIKRVGVFLASRIWKKDGQWFGFPEKHAIFKCSVKGKGKTYDATQGYQGEPVVYFEEVNGYAFGLSEWLDMSDPTNAPRPSNRSENIQGLFNSYSLLARASGLHEFVYELIASAFKDIMKHSVGMDCGFYTSYGAGLRAGDDNVFVADVDALHIKGKIDASGTGYYDLYFNNMLLNAFPIPADSVKFENDSFLLRLAGSEGDFDIYLKDAPAEDFAVFARDYFGSCFPFVYMTRNSLYVGTNASQMYHCYTLDYSPYANKLNTIINNIWQVYRRMSVNVQLSDDGKTADISIIDYNFYKNNPIYLFGASGGIYYKTVCSGVPVDDDGFLTALGDAIDEYYSYNDFHINLESNPYPTAAMLEAFINGSDVEDEEEQAPPPSSSPTPPPPNVIRFVDFINDDAALIEVVNENGETVAMYYDDADNYDADYPEIEKPAKQEV